MRIAWRHNNRLDRYVQRYVEDGLQTKVQVEITARKKTNFVVKLKASQESKQVLLTHTSDSL